MQSTFNSIIELVSYFNSDEKCLAHIEKWRWNGQPECPKCSCKEYYKFKSTGKAKGRYKCVDCYYQYTVTTGTIFHSRKVPLIKWMSAIYFNSYSKKGISSYQLAKAISVTQKTSWFMLTKIREAYKDNNESQLEGVVMCDESFVGGKNKNRHLDKKAKKSVGRLYTDKITVLGMMEMGGRVRTRAIAQPTSFCILPQVYRHIAPKSIIVSDEWAVYQNMSDKYGYETQMIRHARKEFMNDCGFTTNPLEGFWSWIKRTYVGTYHKMSKKHIQRYLNEITFRYNTRDMSSEERLNLIMGRLSFKLTQKDITNEKEVPDNLFITPPRVRRQYKKTGQFIGKFQGRNTYGQGDQEPAAC